MTRLRQVLFFACAWLTFAWFHHSGAGWNVNSRFDLALAIVDDHSLRIERFATESETGTEDVAVTPDGRVYSDKAPGVSFLAAPALLAVRLGEKVVGRRLSLAMVRWTVTAMSVGLLAAGAALLMARVIGLLMLAERAQSGVGSRWREDAGGAREGPEGAAGGLAALGIAPFLLGLLPFVGSPLFYYSTLMMSYAASAFFVLLAMERIEAWRARRLLQPGHAGSRPPMLLVGASLGYAVTCELLAALVVGLVAAYAAWRLVEARRADDQDAGASMGRREFASLALLVAGMGIGIAPFVAYALATFGSITVPYAYEANQLFRENMAHGLMGATWPKWDALVMLTVHPFRGLFAHAPWLLPCVAILASRSGRGWRRQVATVDGPRNCLGLDGPLASCGLAAVAGYLLYNSAYYMWWGGWSFGPRLLSPMIPVLALGVVPIWTARRRWPRAALMALAAPAIALHLVVNATDPQPKDAWSPPSSPPASRISLARLLKPDLEIFDYPWSFPAREWPAFIGGAGDINLGTEALRLPQGPASVLPIFAPWAAFCCLAWWRGGRRSGEAPAG